MKEEHNIREFTGFVDGVLLDFLTLERSIILTTNYLSSSSKTNSHPLAGLIYILEKLRGLKTLYHRITYLQKTIPGYGSATTLRVNTEKKKE